jgi:hypothetical protein
VFDGFINEYGEDNHHTAHFNEYQKTNKKNISVMDRIGKKSNQGRIF